MNSADEWIEKLGLVAHPEGGFFGETYRSDLPAKTSDRVLMTSIYFLLKGKQVSKFHRLKSDELWYFHAGSSVTIHMISSDGELKTVKLGVEAERESPQILISKETWFAAEVNDPESYALMGCVVAPGFEFEDFELADRRAFLQKFPQHAEQISKFV